MSKNTLLFWFNIVLFVVLIITILTFPMDLITHSNIHVYLGLSLCAVALLHLSLHWKWIKNAWQRYDRLPGTIRTKAWLNVRLFITYLICGVVGLSARMMPFPSKHHVFLGVIHVCLAVLLIVLQATHIRHHWKWIKAMARKMVAL